MVVLEQGELAVAMRASMAAPGVFSPVVIDGRVLADGGLMRNLPVDVARDLCADVVIAVWMSSPSPESGDLSAIADAAALGRRIDRSQRPGRRSKASRPPTSASMCRRATCAAPTSSGCRTRSSSDARRPRHSATRCCDTPCPRRSTPLWALSVGRADIETYTLADVRINGTERVNPEYVQAQLRDSVPGATVTAEEVVADIDRVFQLGDFERVNYRFNGEGDVRSLEIDVREKIFGANILRADFGLAAYEAGDLFAIIRLDHDRTWINDHGGRWHNAVQMGRDSLLTSDFYQPLDVRQRFFVQPIAFAEQRREDIYVDDDRVAEYEVRETYGRVDVGTNFGAVAQLRLGFRTGWSEADLDTGLVLPDIARTTDTAVHLQALIDTRDSIGLPTRGSFFNARYVDSTDWFSGDEDYKLVEAVYSRAFPVPSGNSLSLILGGADTLSGELPISQEIELGGIRTFPGLRPGELRGDEYWFAGTAYSWRLFDMLPLFGNALYAGVRFQAGRMQGPLGLGTEDTLLGLSGSVAGRTPIGPFLLALGYVDNGSWQIQFTLGRPLSEGSMLDGLH